MRPPIEGHWDARFAGVLDAFQQNFALDDEVGAALCVRVDGRVVADLWGGWCDAARTRPWRRDTLVGAYSVGKGIGSILALVLAEAGLLDLEARVAGIWPGFEAHGKGELRVADLLAHRAGLPAVREKLPPGAMYDWERMTGELARQAPWWPPGEAHGYHVNTWGFLIGEVVRRRTGMGFGEALRHHLTGPLGAEFHVGLPDAVHDRCARVILAREGPPDERAMEAGFPPTGDPEHELMIRHAYFNPPDLSGVSVANTAAWRRSEIPSTSGHGTARAVARIYAALCGHGRAPLVSPTLLREATAIRSDGPDRVLGRDSRFGLGFQLAFPGRPMGPGEHAFGHYGYGGSLGFADPEARVALGYLMNRPGERWQTPRVGRLVDSVYAAL